MSDWTPTDHPRIETLYTGWGYKVRWEKPVPSTRQRCATCRKDLVPKKDGSLHKHECEPDRWRNWRTVMANKDTERVFGTLGQAIAIAKVKAGITDKPIQNELPGVP